MTGPQRSETKITKAGRGFGLSHLGLLTGAYQSRAPSFPLRLGQALYLPDVQLNKTVDSLGSLSFSNMNAFMEAQCLFTRISLKLRCCEAGQ